LAYVVQVVEACWAAGRPVLIGTSSVNESEVVLQVLQEWCHPGFRELASRVQLLNAKPENVRLEAQVISMPEGWIQLPRQTASDGGTVWLCMGQL
jgi:preprotein translocase subunit SecA